MCATLKEGKRLCEGRKRSRREGRKEGPWNLCVMRVYVGTVWRREGIIEGVREQLWV